MPKLPNALRDWQSVVFSQTLKCEIAALESGSLPLDLGTTHGGYVDDSNLEISVLNFATDDRAIRARVGAFFTEIIANCGCGDEPMPTNAYCEILITIDKQTADAEFAVMPD